MKILMAIFLVLALSLGGVILAKDAIAKVAVEQGVRMVTGLGLKMDAFHIGLRSTLVSIQGLKLLNPAGYPDPVMMDAPEIYVDYNLREIIAGNIYLSEMRLELNEFVVVKRQDGQVNLNALKPVKKAKKEEDGVPSKEPEAPKKVMKIQIDKLKLKIGKVIYKDYSKGGTPTIREVSINIDEEYTNITDPNELVTLIVYKVLMNTPLNMLQDFNIADLQGSMADVLADSTQLAGEGLLRGATLLQGTAGQATQLAGTAATRAKDLTAVAGTLGDTTKDVTGQVAGGFQGAAGTLKSKFKNPFGGEGSTTQTQTAQTQAAAQ